MKLANPPFGNMSGSLGGLTFRTQGNQTVVSAKKIGTPIKSKIQLQTSHIQIEVSNNWGALDELDKAGWDDFAIGSFKPRKSTNTGTASGYNAYFSLNATAKKLQLIQIPSVISSNEIVINEADTNNVYAEIKTPPNSPLTTTIATTSATDNIQVALASVERVDDTINFTLEITTTTSASYELETPLQDSNGNPIAFTIYSSPAKKYATQKSNKKFNSILFSTSPILVSTSPVVEGSIVLSVSIDDLQNCVPAQYNLDKFIDLGLCINSTTGMLQYVNNLTIKVKDIFGEYVPPTNPNLLLLPMASSPFLDLYDTKTEAPKTVPFVANNWLRWSAITADYYVVAGKHQTNIDSSIFIYNRNTDEQIILEERITTDILKIWIDEDKIYVSPALPITTSKNVIIISANPPGYQYYPYLNNYNLNALVFYEDKIYAGAEGLLDGTNCIIKLDKATGNLLPMNFSTAGNCYGLAYSEKYSLLITMEFNSAGNTMKFYSLPDETLVHTYKLPSGASRNIEVLGEYVYFTNSCSTPGQEYFNRINLSTFIFEDIATNKHSGLNYITASNEKIYVSGFCNEAGKSDLAYYNEETDLLVEVEGYEDLSIKKLAGIP